MNIIDISQELFSGRVFPGDPLPKSHKAMKISAGDVCNLTMLEMGAHNATHLDAPYHFYEEGKTIDQLDLTRCIGPCTVLEWDMSNPDWLSERLKSCHKRLLFKGKAPITLNIAKLFNEKGILLVGVEGQTVGQEEFLLPVHYELLKNEVILLEGLVLDHVQTGDYFLCAAPLKLGKSDGAPCRAVLMNIDEICL